MGERILVGCDLHDKNMLLKYAQGRESMQKRSFENTADGRKAMIAILQKQARVIGAKEIVFAYEAAGQGFCLWDELSAAGIVCHVLAPTKIARSVKHRSR